MPKKGRSADEPLDHAAVQKGILFGIIEFQANERECRKVARKPHCEEMSRSLWCIIMGSRAMRNVSRNHARTKSLPFAIGGFFAMQNVIQ